MSSNSDPLALTVESLGDPLRVLFLAANPTDTDLLKIKREYDLVRDTLTRKLGVAGYTISYEPEASIDDLEDLLDQHRPHLVHFAGHGTSEGELLFESESRQAHPVNATVLAKCFFHFGSSVRCILLNACWSQPVAEALTQQGNIPVVIGIAHKVADSDSSAFAEGYYKGLGAKKSLREAFDIGLYHIAKRGTTEVPHYVTTVTPTTLSTTPPPSNLAHAIETHLTALELAFADVMERYVELSGDHHSLNALPTRWQQAIDPIAYSDAIEIAIRGNYRPKNQSQLQPVKNVRKKLGELPTTRSVLLGDPGTGKSWTLFRLALDYAKQWRTTPTTLIPVLLLLQEFKGEERIENEDGTTELRPLRFAEFVERNLGTLQAYYPATLKPHQLLFICDALNEMPHKASDGRDLVAEVRRFLTDKHFVLSCREKEYHHALGTLRPLEEIYLRDLTLPQIRDFLRLHLSPHHLTALWEKMGNCDYELLERFWNQVVEKGEEERFWDFSKGVPNYTKVEEDAEWRKIHKGARLIPLCRTPFMARLLCRTYELAGTLPDNRADLFKDFINALLVHERTQDERRGTPWEEGQLEAIDRALERFANALQAQKSTVLSRTATLHAFQFEPQEDGFAVILTPAVAEEYLATVLSANVLAQEGDAIRFAHQLIQEYFAVRQLIAAEADERSADEFLGETWWDATNWRETFIMLGETYGGIEGINRAARWLAPTSPEIALNLFRNDQGDLDLTKIEPQTRNVIIESANEKTYLDVVPHPYGRAAAYRALGLLSADTRRGVGVRPDGLPDIEWCSIPAGDFSYQDGTATIPYSYYIAKYPVTYQQYETFIQAGVYDQAQWWEGLQKEEPYRQSFQYSNHPRDSITWWQSVAFTRWLTHTMQAQAAQILTAESLTDTAREAWQGLQAGRLVVSLPTEEEWEKAARGNDGREYPWGDRYVSGYANVDETEQSGGPYYLEQTSAVGAYPKNESPYGVMDMAGNVWEWTLSAYEEAEKVAEQRNGWTLHNTQAARVVRGGSWDNYRHGARAAFRYGSRPYSRDLYGGCRVVLVPAPSRSVL